MDSIKFFGFYLELFLKVERECLLSLKIILYSLIKISHMLLSLDTVWHLFIVLSNLQCVGDLLWRNSSLKIRTRLEPQR